MILTAVEETGLSADNRKKILTSVKQHDYILAKELLHKERDSLLAEIHQKEDAIRHIDWIIYSLSRAES